MTAGLLIGLTALSAVGLVLAHSLRKYGARATVRMLRGDVNWKTDDRWPTPAKVDVAALRRRLESKGD